MAITKASGVTFEHSDDFKGEVRIVRNGVALSVPMAALRGLVAEAVRSDRIAELRDAKPEAVLRSKA